MCENKTKRISPGGMLPAVWMVVILLAAALWLPAKTMMATSGGEEKAPAAFENSSGEAGKKPLSITVVEEIPAVDIEENTVPLAAFPEKKTGNELRHMVWAGAALLAVLAYLVYFFLYDRKLLRLRNEVIMAEYRRRGREGAGG